MEQRPLGDTGLRAPRIVFGAGAQGGAVIRPSPELRLAAVRRALDLGIDWFDTAPSYGDGQSEENLGSIFDELGVAPRVSTKVRLAPEELDDIPGAVRRSLERSLQRLRRPSVELIQLHNPIAAERTERGGLAVQDVLGPGGVAEAFDAVVGAGLASLAGFTALGETDALHELVASGRFQTLQAYHNLLNPSASRRVALGFSALDYRRIIEMAAGRGMGVLNIRVLAAGIAAGDLAPEGGSRFVMSPGSDAESDARRAALVAEALEGEPGTMAQRAIRFALATPGVSAVLVGFGTIEHIDDAVEALDQPPLSETAMQRLDALYATDFAP